MTNLQRILTAGMLSLMMVTVSYGGTITGSRTSASGARVGTITGSRTGTITGSRAGTITGSRVGTITGSRIETTVGSGEVMAPSNLHDEFLYRVISLLLNATW